MAGNDPQPAETKGFNWSVLGFITGFWARRRRAFAIGLALSVIVAALDLTLPWTSGELIDAVAGGSRASRQPWQIWLLFIGAYAVAAIVQTVSSRLWFTLNARSMEDLIVSSFAKVQDFSSDWHADSLAGATVRRLTRGMWGYELVSNVVMVWAGPGVITTLGLIILLLTRQPAAGLTALAVATAYILINILIASGYMQAANIESNARDAELGGIIADAVTSNATVKSFGAEEFELDGVKRAAALWRKAILVTWSRMANITLLQNALLVALQAGMTGIMVHAWANNRATPGDVAFSITAVTLMSNRLRGLGDSLQWLQKGVNDTSDLAIFAKALPAVADQKDAEVFIPGPGQITFDDVTFGYRGAAPLYEGFSLDIAPGEHLALVGSTGSGKSTFIRLIQRLHDIQGGRIAIDGQDIAIVQQRSLRWAIAVVPQDPVLLHRSILENIAYGRPGASLEDVIQVAKQARAHDFITALPNGYASTVGERGVKLSGGERQRIAIARALLIDAPILILDEATSALDVETEALVQAATKAVMRGRTTIVIAHRLFTVRNVDRILVFQNGRVIEEGTHRELTVLGGAYARMNTPSA